MTTTTLIATHADSCAKADSGTAPEGIGQLILPVRPLRLTPKTGSEVTLRRDRPFLAGPENALVLESVRAISEKTAPSSWNPLVIYGSTGLGKSHLASGLAWSWTNKNPKKEVLYQHSADLLTEYTEAVRAATQRGFSATTSSEVISLAGENSVSATASRPALNQPDDGAVNTQNSGDLGVEPWKPQPHPSSAGDSSLSLREFRERFEGLDLWVLEDVDLLADKAGTQRELISLLDTVLANGCQVILTAKVHPLALDGFSRSLLSRLAAGLAVPLAVPTVSTRRALAFQFAQELAIPLSASAAQGLAAAELSPRELVGLLVQLETAARVDRRPIREGDVQERLAGRSPSTEVPLKRIAWETARHYSLRVGDLRGSSRQRSVSEARGVAIHLARELTSASLQQIGRYFNRDHSTVLHAHRKTGRQVAENSAVASVVEKLRTQLQASVSPRKPDH